eukprot:COSAG03_NODE_36_length_17658_cov_56.766900_9_plen_152_part_00
MSGISTHQINNLDMLGVLVWLCGMCIEHTADMQKSRWNSKYASNQQKTWLASGLWAWSRHPNFFGEHVLWWGSAIVAMAGLSATEALPSYAPFGCVLAVISPLWSSFFLFFTSLMLLEKRLDAKFGGQPAYERYKRETSVFFFWPPPATKP